jgi:hypothetical protein
MKFQTRVDSCLNWTGCFLLCSFPLQESLTKGNMEKEVSIEQHLCWVKSISIHPQLPFESLQMFISSTKSNILCPHTHPNCGLKLLTRVVRKSKNWSKNLPQTTNSLIKPEFLCGEFFKMPPLLQRIFHYFKTLNMDPIALGFKPRTKPTLQFWGSAWRGGKP